MPQQRLLTHTLLKMVLARAAASRLPFFRVVSLEVCRWLVWCKGWFIVQNKAKRHGAYPFWWGGGSDSGTADLEVWWSEKQGHELCYHRTCTGLDSWNSGGKPCYHLMNAPKSSHAAPLSYLFNEEANTGGGTC